MKMKLSAIFCTLLIIISCTKNSSEHPDVDVIYLNISKTTETDYKKVFSLIEIIPLETTDSSLIDKVNAKETLYVPNKYFIVIDKQRILSVFDSTGKFISNSSSCIGEGPQQYYIFQDFTYNDQKQSIDILDVYGNIISYDINFNFLSKTKIGIKPEDRFRRIHYIGENLYALIDDHEYSTVYFYDCNTDKILKKTQYYGTLALQSASIHPFKQIGESIYFIPPTVNDNIFLFNKESHVLHNILNIDSGDEALKCSDLKDLDITTRETTDYILNSSKYFCIDRYFNEKHITSIYLKQQKRYINFFNINSGENFTFSIKIDDQIKIPVTELFSMDESSLYAIIYPFEIDKYVDINLLSNKEIINNIDDDNNQVIIKYYLK
jgi:hypothetical protein